MNPTNLQECIDFLTLSIPKEDYAQYKGMSLDEFTSMCHFGLGLSIRNNWNLWDKTSNLHKHFNEIGIHHPDDMSSIITKSFWAKVTGAEYDLKKDIEHYQEYWKVMNERFSKMKPVLL